eukprot:scaffold6751_cov188-Skeletonema_menzelii.AAC.2
MSSDGEEAADEVCASCGIAEGDDVKLKKCACDLVKYCNDGCRELHRPEHEGACKKKTAKIRDVLLFTQPEMSHLGECPICCLPNPLDETKSGHLACCSQRICQGCSYAHQKREQQQGRYPKCPFCRAPMPKSDKEHKKNMKNRIKANNSYAMVEMGTMLFHKGDYDGAFKHWTKAAELGDVLAHYELALLYRRGEGVEMNRKKEIYHTEQAAIGGHATARNNLAMYELHSGNMDRAVKHFIVSAKLGFDSLVYPPLDYVKLGFAKGLVSKEEYAAALRGYQAAVDATKSQQRDEAYAFLNIADNGAGAGFSSIPSMMLSMKR